MPKRPYTNETILIAQRLAARPEGRFLHDTACMHPEEKELYGDITALLKLIPEDQAKEFRQFCEMKLLPVIQVMGMSRWEPQELTNLCLKYGKGGIPISLKGVKREANPT